MKSTIDYLFKDLSDNKEGKKMFGFSAQTVKKCINNIEQTYFDGRKIYHGLSESQNNAIIFRCEIKGLLLLLLKLELENVFRDDKSKKSGVTISSIDRIFDTYKFALDEEFLSDYEYRVLMQFSDIEDEFTFYESIKSFRNELSRLLIILATTYDDHAANYFKMVIKRIRNISASMLYGSFDIKVLNKERFLQPLDLRLSLIKAINEICTDLYWFNKDNLCQRKMILFDNAALSEEYSKICIKHICMEGEYSDQQREKVSEEFPHDEDDITDIRNELTSFLNKYYESKYPYIPKQTYIYPTKEIMDERFETLRRKLNEYIDCYCTTQKIMLGKIPTEEINTIPKDYLRYLLRQRFFLNNLTIFDWSFNQFLPKLEDELSDRIKTDSTQLNKEEILEKYMKEYTTDVYERLSILKKGFNNYDNKEFLKNNYCNIIDNIEDIEAHCEALAKNIIAMILKRETDKWKEQMQF